MNVIRPVIIDVNNKLFDRMLKEPLGQSILEFLCKEINIIRMIDASNLRRPAVEVLSEDIYNEFVSPISDMTQDEVDKWKQFIGYIIRIIMEHNGYIHVARNIDVKYGSLFKKASKYKKVS